MTREELTTRLTKLEEQHGHHLRAMFQIEGAMAIVREMLADIPATNGEDRTNAVHD